MLSMCRPRKRASQASMKRSMNVPIKDQLLRREACVRHSGLKLMMLVRAAAVVWPRIDTRRVKYLPLTGAVIAATYRSFCWGCCRSHLEQASLLACTVILLNIARSPWAPAQAPQDAGALILRPSTGTVDKDDP